MVHDIVVVSYEATIQYDLWQRRGWSEVITKSAWVKTDHLTWITENCSGAYLNFGRNFLFENEEDALMFALRWG